MRRVRRRAVGGAALAAVAASWVEMERRHRAALRADAAAAELAPLPDGRPLAIHSADGTIVAGEEHGPPDGPVVVFAHGWTCAGRFWARVMRRLIADVRCVTYDQRGHGDTPATRGMGQRQLAEDLDAVLAAACRDGERAILVGHSMGAMAAVAWAGAFPDRVHDRVAAALLLNTRVEPLPRHRGLARTYDVIVLRHPLPARADWWWQRQLLRTSHHAGASPAAVALSTELYAACRPAARRVWGRFLERLDLRADIAAFDVPTTVLASSLDVLTPAQHGRWLADALPNLHRYVELPSIGHSTPLDAPDAVAHEIRDLLVEYGRRNEEAG